MLVNWSIEQGGGDRGRVLKVETDPGPIAMVIRVKLVFTLSNKLKMGMISSTPITVATLAGSVINEMLLPGDRSCAFRQLRARRALSLFNDVLRTRRVLSLYKFYGDSALLVLNRTLSNNDNALLALI